MSQSPMLTRFYHEYLKWIESDTPENGIFKRYWGLCSNLKVFSFVTAQDDIREPEFDYCDELADQFVAARLHRELPFNDTRSEYSEESRARSCDLNQKRIAWVRKHAALGENHA